MTTEEEMLVVERLLEGVAAVNEKCIDFGVQLGRHQAVVESRGGFDLRGYSAGWMLERYIEADTRDGRNICWWLDVSINDERWTIRTEIRESHGKTLKIFPEITVNTLDELLRRLNSAQVWGQGDSR